MYKTISYQLMWLLYVAWTALWLLSTCSAGVVGVVWGPLDPFTSAECFMSPWSQRHGIKTFVKSESRIITKIMPRAQNTQKRHFELKTNFSSSYADGLITSLINQWNRPSDTKPVPQQSISQLNNNQKWHWFHLYAFFGQFWTFFN